MASSAAAQGVAAAANALVAHAAPAADGAVAAAALDRHGAAAAAVVGAPKGAAGPGRDPSPPLGVSASVGHDDWASDVLSAVPVAAAPEQPPPPHPAAVEASSLPTVAVPSQTVPSDPPKVVKVEESARAPVPEEPDPPLDPVARLVLDKKRKFHAGRMLEVKNLPDCTEQVGQQQTTAE